LARKQKTKVKRAPGFTLIELITVVIIMAVTLSMMGFTFNRYLARTSAKRAAELFGQDLMAARSTAIRSRQRVVVDFDEASLGYVIRVEAGDTLFRRIFDKDEAVTLSGLDLEMAGDTVAFDRRGVANLSGAGGALGRVVFTAGKTSYAVSFNRLGSFRVGGT